MIYVFLAMTHNVWIAHLTVKHVLNANLATMLPVKFVCQQEQIVYNIVLLREHAQFANMVSDQLTDGV